MRSSVCRLALAGTMMLAACSSDTVTSPTAASQALAGTVPTIALSTTTPQQVAALEAVTTAPALRIDAHALYYCYHPGTVRLCIVLKHQLRITSSGAALKWTASKDKLWIVLSSAGGTTPSTLTVSVNPQELPSLSHTVRGSVTIAAAGASNSPQTVLVEVNGQIPPALAFSDSAIGFCDAPGSTRNCVRLQEDVLLTSTGAPLAWRARSSAAWITLHPTSGTTPTTVRVAVDLSKLPVPHGTLVSGSITVSSGAASNSPQQLPVKLQFYSSPPPL